MRDTARKVLREARRLAPRDEGTLAKSGRVGVDDTTVYVRFTAPHAWLQHERLDYQHPKGGQAKYLETPALEISEASIIEGVKARLR